MFRDQLVATPEVAGEVSADAVAAGHQQIDEVVDHDRDLRSINRLKSDRPTRLDSHDLLTLQSSLLRWQLARVAVRIAPWPERSSRH